MVFRSPRFIFVFISQFFSLVADNLYLIALPWLALQATGSTLVLGSVFAIAAIPRALLLPIGGVWADRMGPHRTLLGFSLLRGLVLLGLALLLSQAEVWALYPAAALLGVISAFYYPAKMALIPRVVTAEQLSSANGLFQGTTHLLGIVGPALGGVAVGVLGGVATLVVAAAACGVTAIALLFVRLQKLASLPGSTGFLQQLKEGVGVVWRDPVLRWLIVVIAFNNLGFVGPFYVGIPALIRQSYGLGAEAFGTLTAAFSLGSLLGILLAALTGKSKAKGKLAVGSFIVTNLGLGAVGIAPGFSFAMAFLLVAGIGSGVGNILLVTLLQLRTSSALIGRVMSLVLVGSFGLSPLSQFLAGVFAEYVEVTLLFPLGAAISLAALAFGARWILRLEREEGVIAQQREANV